MGLALQVVRRRRWIALAWLGTALLLLPRARHAAELLETSARVNGSESEAVERLLAGPLASVYARSVLLVVAGVPSPDRPEGEAVLRTIVARLRLAPQVSGLYSYLDGQDGLFLAPRGHGTFVVVGLLARGAPPDKLIPPLRELGARIAADLQRGYPGLALRWTGDAALNLDLRKTSGVDIGKAERRALPLTAVLLLIAFGALLAALLPVVSGALAIALALGAAALLARLGSLSILLQSVVTMLGLGLGIDYALLTVSRFREGLAEGMSATTAAVSAARHAGHTILLSAAAVAVGFTALLTVPLNEIRAIAVGGLLITLTSALLATTLLPGLLAWLATRIDWGRIRRRSAAPASAERWRRLGELVTGHPWKALALGAAPLLFLALQATRLHTGLPRGDWLPKAMESARGLEALREMGRGGVIQTVRLVVELPEGSSVRRNAGWGALARFSETLAQDPRVEQLRSIVEVARAAGMGRSALAFLGDSLTRGLVSADGRLVLLELIPRESLAADGLTQLVRELRRDAAGRLGIRGARVLVGGLPAFNADYRDASAGRFGQVALLVVGGTLGALFLGFRSVLVPLKAMALNLLSVAAAFGALTLVFQEGYGRRLFGVAEPLGAVFSTLPVIVFCIVFGLSMDYEVFLMTRVLESRRAGSSDRVAIVEALRTTGPVITSAAAIMLAVFSAFTLGDFLFVKMLGFALGVAVLLDATVVRMVVGPALLQLAGQWNWWPGNAGLRIRPGRQLASHAKAG